MDWDLWRYEARRLGWPAFVAPLLATAAILLLAGLAEAVGPRTQVNRILSGLLDVMPITAGIAAASGVGGDGCLELQLSLPTSFERTIARRLAVAGALVSAIALVVTCGLAETGRLAWPISLPADQLIWLVPSLWLAGVGAASALGARAASAGIGIVAAVWILEQLLSDLLTTQRWLGLIWLTLRFDPANPAAWWINRLVLLGLALLLTSVVRRLLANSELLLQEEA